MNLLLLKILYIGANYFVVNVAEINSNQSTVDCIVQAVHLIAKYKIALEYTEDSGDFATDILRKVNIPVVVNTVEYRQVTDIELRTSIDVLILLKDAEARKVTNETLWKGDTRFIIVTNNEEKVEDYFEQFWKLKVINVFVIVTGEGNNTVYSFLPYGKENCSKPEVTIVDSCVTGRLEKEGAALRDLMRIKNMNQCPINVTINHVRPYLIFEPKEGWKNSTTIKGCEGNFMVEVAKLYNFNATFKISEDGMGWGWILPHPEGTIGDLYRRITDITIGMQAPLMQRFIYLDLAANFNMDECVTFGVPKGYGATQPAWLKNFVLEFTYHTWISIVVSFVIVSINVWLINKYLSIAWLRGNAEIALFIFSSCLGLPVKTPKLMSAKTSIIFWIASSFILTVAFKASMGSMLAVPPKDADINTAVELLQSDLQLMGLKDMMQTIEPRDEWPYSELRSRYKFTNECMEDIVLRMANREKISYLRHRASFYYFALVNPQARGRINTIQDCMLNYHPYAMLQKHSPFTRRVSQIVRRLEESGIMEMWRAEYIKDIPLPKKPFFKLSMKQMFGVFCFLMVGYVVAFISFLYEVYFVFGIRKPLSFLFPFSYFDYGKKKVVIVHVRGATQHKLN